MLISNRLLKAASAYVQSAALFVDNTYYNYQELLLFAVNLTHNLPSQCNKLGVLCHRDLNYYACVFASTLTQGCFVPLGVKFPISRLVSIIEQSELQYIVYSEQFEELVDQLQIHCLNVRFLPCEQLIERVETQISSIQASTNEFAYILFTSGSTGAPKGVPISHQNLATYVNYMTDTLQLNADDKVSQIFDPTFDLSMHDIFVTWLSGACLYVVPDNQLLAPGKFIKQHQLTVWFSVPSTLAIMTKLGMTKTDAYNSIRYSLFCGEPLPVSLAKQWQLAARNSRLINLYGPTEATIACSAHEFNENHDYQSTYLPIGKAFPHMSFSQSESEELVINGPQVFAGYLNNPCKTNESLKLFDGALSYFSGDIVAKQQNGEFIYLSRKDDQVKIQGFRVELSEIDALVQSFLNNPLVKSVATPKHMPKTITLFICDTADKDVEQALMNCLKHKLPSYMLPKKIVWLDSMPLNSNGKINKIALHSMQEKK